MNLLLASDRGSFSPTAVILAPLYYNEYYECERPWNRAIAVMPFEGDMRDSELLDLLPYLSSLCDVENVRTIEKRRWRERAREEEP